MTFASAHLSSVLSPFFITDSWSVSPLVQEIFSYHLSQWFNSTECWMVVWKEAFNFCTCFIFNLCLYDRKTILLLDLVPARLALVGLNAQNNIGQCRQNSAILILTSMGIEEDISAWLHLRQNQPKMFMLLGWVKFKRAMVQPHKFNSDELLQGITHPWEIGLQLHRGRLAKMAQHLLLAFSSKPVLERLKKRPDTQDWLEVASFGN